MKSIDRSTLIDIVLMLFFISLTIWVTKESIDSVPDHETTCIDNKIYTKSVSGKYWIRSSEAFCVSNGELK
jgi:hypothetical protein